MISLLLPWLAHTYKQKIDIYRSRHKSKQGSMFIQS